MNRLVIAGPTLYIGYHTCKITCSETHCRYGLQSVPCLRVMLNEEESASQLYRHCEGVLCAMVRPANAITRVDGAVQLNESLRVNCKLCGTTCPSGAIELSGSRLLGIPANANIPKASPAPPVPACVSTLLDWALGICAIAVKCDLCSFSE